MHPGLIIYEKGSKNIQWRKTVSSINDAGKVGKLHVKRMKLEHFFSPFTKINSKWIKDLNIRPKTKKLLEENIGRTVSDINCSNIFWICLPKQRQQ